MTGCLYCIDNDIIQKLATFDLFEQTLDIFDASPTDINILLTAKYKFRRDWEKVKAGRHRNPEATVINYEKVVGLAETLPQIIDATIDTDLFIQLSAFDNIDQGEATLTAHVAKVLQKEDANDVFILTGDKRYLRALARVELPLIQESFTHRFWCLEQLMLKNIQENEFESIRDKVVPVRDCDKACKVAFGSGAYSTEGNAVAALTEYIEALRNETGNLLHPYPASLHEIAKVDTDEY